MSRISLHEFRCHLLSPHCKHDGGLHAQRRARKSSIDRKELLGLFSSGLDNLDDGKIKEMSDEFKTLFHF